MARRSDPFEREVLTIVPERLAAELVTIHEAISAVEAAFAALARDEAHVFPVAAGTAGDSDRFLAIKGGYLGPAAAFGVKAGTYFPGNRLGGLPSHNSTVLLLDPETGRPEALVGAGALTALRTAAADAVAVRWLARPEARRLALIGAGHQALHEALAIACVRDLEEVRVWSRSAGAAETLARTLAAKGLPARPATLSEALLDADIIVTATGAEAPIVPDRLVPVGAHISAMGADSDRKQELELATVVRGRRFADSPKQSVSIGEFRSAAAERAVTPATITPIGQVINGTAPGRTSPEDVTIFDSSGMAVQDLAVAQLALVRAREAGRALEVAW